MDTFFFYTPYYFLVLLIIASTATGIIFNKNRSKENGLIFLGFVIYTCTLVMNTYFGYSASFDLKNNVTEEVEGILSLNQNSALQLIATLFLSVGFGIKAYALIKKT